MSFFLEWWFHHSELDLDDVNQLDEALATYHAIYRPSKVRTANLLAGVERALPMGKRQLTWFKMITQDSIQFASATHALSMPLAACLPLAVVISQRYSARIGALVLIQHSRGLRPGEVLGMEPASVTLPEESIYNTGLISLGIRSSTKVGRPEFVVLPPSECFLAIKLLRWLKSITPPHLTFSLKLSVQSYSNCIRKTAVEMGLPPYTGHSPRAGYVSDACLLGHSRDRIRTVTRHSSDATLKVYMDAVSHLRQVHAGPVSRYVHVSRLISQYPEKFFPRIAGGNLVLDPMRT